VAGRYPEVRCLRQEHGGAGTARNLGVQQAQGELLAFLDADDLWIPNKLSLQTAALGENRGGTWCSGPWNNSTARNWRRCRTLRAGETPAPGCVPGAMLIRRKSFFRVGLFQPNCGSASSSTGTPGDGSGLVFQQSPDVVLRRRIHNTNLGIRERGARGDYARVVKAALDRAGKPLAAGAGTFLMTRAKQ